MEVLGDSGGNRLAVFSDEVLVEFPDELMMEIPLIELVRVEDEGIPILLDCPEVDGPPDELAKDPDGVMIEVGTKGLLEPEMSEAFAPILVAKPALLTALVYEGSPELP